MIDRKDEKAGPADGGFCTACGVYVVRENKNLHKSWHEKIERRATTDAQILAADNARSRAEISRDDHKARAEAAELALGNSCAFTDSLMKAFEPRSDGRARVKEEIPSLIRGIKRRADGFEERAKAAEELLATIGRQIPGSESRAPAGIPAAVRALTDERDRLRDTAHAWREIACRPTGAEVSRMWVDDIPQATTHPPALRDAIERVRCVGSVLMDNLPFEISRRQREAVNGCLNDINALLSLLDSGSRAEPGGSDGNAVHDTPTSVAPILRDAIERVRETTEALEAAARDPNVEYVNRESEARDDAISDLLLLLDNGARPLSWPDVWPDAPEVEAVDVIAQAPPTPVTDTVREAAERLRSARKYGDPDVAAHADDLLDALDAAPAGVVVPREEWEAFAILARKVANCFDPDDIDAGRGVAGLVDASRALVEAADA